MKLLGIESPPIGETLKVGSFFFGVAALFGLFNAVAKRLSLRDTLTAAGVSGAGGFVVGLLCVQFWGVDRWYLTCAVCGIAGWLGGKVVLDRLSIVAFTIARQRLATLESAGKEQTDASSTLPLQSPATGDDRPHAGL